MISLLDDLNVVLLWGWTWPIMVGWQTQFLWEMLRTARFKKTRTPSSSPSWLLERSLYFGHLVYSHEQRRQTNRFLLIELTYSREEVVVWTDIFYRRQDQPGAKQRSQWRTFSQRLWQRFPSQFFRDSGLCWRYDSFFFEIRGGWWWKKFKKEYIPYRKSLSLSRRHRVSSLFNHLKRLWDFRS